MERYFRAVPQCSGRSSWPARTLHIPSALLQTHARDLSVFVDERDTQRRIERGPEHPIAGVDEREFPLPLPFGLRHHLPVLDHDVNDELSSAGLREIIDPGHFVANR